MAIYQVLVPSIRAGSAPAEDEVAFVRDGFCWPALLFGPLWLLARGLWRALVAWCVGAAVVGTAAHYALMPASAAAWLYILSALWLGLEGSSLIAAARRRGGLSLVDVAVGADIADAEHGFFSRWLAAPAPVAAPTPLSSPQRPLGGAGPRDVIGLFPEPGG